ncbi:ABC transporter permease [Nocardioides sp. GXQ0305]|uniref:ABC transporter permease n=1 Tax=Nocardioides sp. GXQ0305 TaxID=3423912 RepID=UPI003D7EDC5C
MSRSGGPDVGAGVLLRAYLRRDRWMLFWWTIGGAVLYWSQAVSVEGLYTSQAEFDRAAAAMGSNPALVAMAGPARALNTVGGQVTWQATAFGAIVAGLMSMFLVGRHTRAEEESGRDELVRASAIGRRAPVTATVLEVVVANVLLGALIAVSLIVVPLAVADSVALGVGAALCGVAFGGVALVAAQLTSTTRATYGITGAAMAAAYALRAVGDVGNEALSWLSPIGWYQRMYAFSGLRWWPALLLLALAVVMLVAAYAVLERRDIGSGIFAARPGPATAARRLGTPVGLAWRLQRGTVVGWALGLGFTGLAYGSIGDSAGDLIGDNEAAAEMMTAGGGDMVAGFQAVSMVMLALLTAGFAISSALRPRTEEESGRVEPVLATATSRTRWLLGNVVVTVAGSALVLGVAGLGMGLGYVLVTGKEEALWRMTWQTLTWLPAVLVLSGLTRLLHGVRPRLATFGWLGLGYAVVVLVLAEILQFPDWMRDLSPFEHLALVPAVDFDPTAFAAVLAVATLLGVGGWLAFLRRDVG